jgi:hypothetical protein
MGWVGLEGLSEPLWAGLRLGNYPSGWVRLGSLG